MAQKKQLAADKALGLSERSKTLVADFGELTKKGETTAAALGKIGKDMDLLSTSRALPMPAPRWMRWPCAAKSVPTRCGTPGSKP